MWVGGFLDVNQFFGWSWGWVPCLRDASVCSWICTKHIFMLCNAGEASSPTIGKQNSTKKRQGLSGTAMTAMAAAAARGLSWAWENVDYLILLNFGLEKLHVKHTKTCFSTFSYYGVANILAKGP